MIKFSEHYNESEIPFKDVIYDRMTENIVHGEPDLDAMFAHGEPAPLEVIDFKSGTSPIEVLKAYNKKHGLSLDQPEMEYLVEEYARLGSMFHFHSSTAISKLEYLWIMTMGSGLRQPQAFNSFHASKNDANLRIIGSPTDIEIFMFGQVNSEHCRRTVYSQNL